MHGDNVKSKHPPAPDKTASFREFSFFTRNVNTAIKSMRRQTRIRILSKPFDDLGRASPPGSDEVVQLTPVAVCRCQRAVDSAAFMAAGYFRTNKFPSETVKLADETVREGTPAGTRVAPALF